MATTNTVDVTVGYADYTSRKYSLPWDTEAITLAGISTAAAAFNAAAQTDNSSVKQVFRSDDGAPIVGVTKVEAITETTEVIYSAES